MSGHSFHRGLSPRVRGNQVGHGQPLHFPRSIPACTGEPGSQAIAGAVPRVYPRVYGGTMPRRWVFLSVNGLSPRVRGNRSGLAPDS